jgi:hypothetical protein
MEKFIKKSFYKFKKNKINLIVMIIIAIIAIITIIISVGLILNRINKNNENFENKPKLYCFWTGDNPLTENRKRNLKTLKNTGFDVVLVTPENLKQYILKEHPLHEGYQYLSATHKSDYLRCYFMNFYGGGYSDIKKVEENWMDYYKKLMESDYWGVGYTESDFYLPHHNGDKNIDKILRENYKEIIGAGKFIFKPNTPLTNEWYTGMMNKMDDIYLQLKKYPSQSGEHRQVYTKEYPYPLRWHELLGEIYHPIVYKYKDKLIKDLPYVNIENYV